jgi:hypothetical protein
MKPMPTLKPRNSTALFSFATSSGTLIQIVATSRGIVFDVQATNVGSDGHAYKCHAVAKLALDEVMRLQTVLDQAVDASWDCESGRTERTDERQIGLWSPSTYTAPVRRAA